MHYPTTVKELGLLREAVKRVNPDSSLGHIWEHCVEGSRGRLLYIRPIGHECVKKEPAADDFHGNLAVCNARHKRLYRRMRNALLVESGGLLLTEEAA